MIAVSDGIAQALKRIRSTAIVLTPRVTTPPSPVLSPQYPGHSAQTAVVAHRSQN
ncbi:hypothetical protein [Sphaerospermopsis reniformis]|uniref:hypothetical protein n=1 Tax=Sphaerospermopsis reniformis TaxID=531300 RepID=UPI00139688B9|nr:hypothetical protein [Sphaerospermopsis reniformis]